jgi:HEPN domain-containing protein
MSGPHSNSAAWLAKAENDLLNIENNITSDHVPWDTICFHAQQAAEKLLKGFLVFHGCELIRTHDLVALLSACVQVVPDLEILERDCQRLTYFAVASRYPDDLYEPDERDGREMIEAVRRVRNEVLSYLKR